MTPAPAVSLLWLPLGAGGVGYVRFNGRIYERLSAVRGRRAAFDLYHTALEVAVPEGRFVIENAWPSPDRDTGSRGVVVEGPVFHPALSRFRPFRYEVRRWRDGLIADAWAAVAVDVLSTDSAVAASLLRAVERVPAMPWGRTVPGETEMWNSNSVIAYVLEVGGVPVDPIRPPAGGRAPGWQAGVALARRSPESGHDLR
jgi:hypothetical protein